MATFTLKQFADRYAARLRRVRDAQEREFEAIAHEIESIPYCEDGQLLSYADKMIIVGHIRDALSDTESDAGFDNVGGADNFRYLQLVNSLKALVR